MICTTAVYPIISPNPTQPTLLVLDDLLSGNAHAPEKSIEIVTCTI